MYKYYPLSQFPLKITHAATLSLASNNLLNYLITARVTSHIGNIDCGFQSRSSEPLPRFSPDRHNLRWKPNSTSLPVRSTTVYVCNTHTRVSPSPYTRSLLFDDSPRAREACSLDCARQRRNSRSRTRALVLRNAAESCDRIDSSTSTTRVYREYTRGG